jgi:NADPH-dependent ferric siderophore reductase
MTELPFGIRKIEKSATDISDMMRRRGLSEWQLRTVSTVELSPSMRRISLAVDSNVTFSSMPGQDLVFMLPDLAGGVGRRHYTIRRFRADEREVDIDVFLHGSETPGARWALRTTPGDTVTAYGPRGRNILHPDADWRLFVGDDTAVPAITGMIEALPSGARALAICDIATTADRQNVVSKGNVDIEWISRDGKPPVASNRALIDRVASWQLPSGIGHVYLLGETSTVRRLRHDLLARGVQKDKIFGEGYWRPGRIGGHDHLEEH